MDHARWTPAYVALGSNLDEPAQQVRRAMVELSRLPDSHLLCSSSLYQSQPMGPQAQPLFVNAVAALLTKLDAQQLLSELQRIEIKMGRQVSRERWGPRIIDLDLLMFGEMRSADLNLQLPHPGMLQRNFVMVPLAEIASHLSVANGSSAAAIAQKLGMDGLRRLPE